MRNVLSCATRVGLSLSLAVFAGGTAAAAEALKPAVSLPGDPSALTAPAGPTIAPTADLLLDEPVLAPPVAQPWIWAITPRAWLLWENDFYFQHENPRFQQSNEAVFIPFAGGSVSVTPGLGAPTYSLTALYGEGTSEVIGLGLSPNDVPIRFESDVETKRLDVEGIVQIPAAEGASWILGARFIRFDRHEDSLFINDIVTDPAHISEEEWDLEQHFYLGEAGFSINRPINDAGSFIAFGNLTGMIGYADVVKDSRIDPGIFNVPEDDMQGGVVGIDTNAGLGYRLSPRVFASARYRLFYLTAPQFKFKDGGTFMHGPEVNVTFSFGG